MRPLPEVEMLRRTFRRVWLPAAAASVLAAGAGCTRSNRHAVSVVGSTSIQPFAEMLAHEYHCQHAEESAEVQGGGSTAGLQAVTEGIADIGMCSRALKREEIARGFVPFTIARDGLAIVVHPSNGITNLTRTQIRGMFVGSVRNWREVGGDDRPVRTITREEGSGTREAFVKLVMEGTRISRSALTQESNGAVRELVKHDPCAIGYMSLGLVGGEMRAVPVDGAPATAAGVKSGAYPLVRPFLMVVKERPTPPARRFLDFVLSARAQSLLEHEGLIGTAGAP
jgi:phosphate transport system substrate-binding protein